MDARSITEGSAARLSTSPDGHNTEPDGVKSAMTGTPNGIRSSPPTLLHNVHGDSDLRMKPLGEVGEKSDSEAETIVLPGKDGYSPSKIRKSIKHEDRSEDEEMRDAPPILAPDLSVLREENREQRQGKEKDADEATATSTLGKRKRPKNGFTKDDPAHLANSSGLSSAPTSPPATTRSSLSKPAASDSEISRSASPRSRSRSSVREKGRGRDRALPHGKRYASGSGDDEGVEPRRFRRQQSSGIERKASREARDNRLSSKFNNRETSPRKVTRSTSPHSRLHRRSVSSQLPSKSSHGLSHKKKRVPAPLQSTEYHSDDSSASGSSHPRSSRLRHLAAPTTGDSAISPAKMAPHKKHVNSSGQTLLAIACSRGRLDNVKQRYEERPEDLNLADNAKNTPLHIASLSGFTEVVKFLLGTGKCKLDEVNLEKDTPLHDAVDNKNVAVVKLLLDAGANPNKPNKAGNEPLDLLNVFDDMDDEQEQEEVAEMRTAILAAKAMFAADTHHKHEENPNAGNTEHKMSRPRGSPRPTLSYHTHDSDNYQPPTKKAGTARSMVKTKDRALYQHLDIPTMRNAARDGDIQTISRILDVLPKADDAQTLYNAARGGHDSIVNLLFALGSFNPDPDPDSPVLDGVPLDQATPILAAIGKEDHLAIIDLILGHSAFDPTRRIRGETYSQIAKRRAGPRWQEEVKAFDKAVESYKGPRRRTTSPTLRRDAREPDREARKQIRRDGQQTSQVHKRRTSSPKAETTKSQHKAVASSSHPREGHTLSKRGPGRPRKEESTVARPLSDAEQGSLAPPKQKIINRKSEPDAVNGSESEPTIKPRRKLVSGKEFRGERDLEKQRRASVASNVSSVSLKEKRERGPVDSKPETTKSERLDGKASPSVPRTSKISNSTHSDRDLLSERHSIEKDRARSIKRDDSKDRLSAIRSESPVKRQHRNSATPPRSNMQEMTPAYGIGGAPQKRRKLEGDTGHRAESTPGSSPEHRGLVSKAPLPREKHSSKPDGDSKDKVPRTTSKHSDSTAPSKDPIESDKVSPKRPAKAMSSASGHVSDHPVKKTKHSGERPPKEIVENSPGPTKDEEAESMRQAQIRRDKKAVELARQKEAEEEKEREREKELEKEKEREKEREKEKERVQMEQARLERAAREEEARLKEEKRQRDEAERKERQRLEDIEAHKRAEEEKKALYVEQERLKREELERRRQHQLEQQRLERARIEKEKREERLAKLPLLLKWFDLVDEPRVPSIAGLFRRIEGFRYDTIRPETTGQANGREQWMLNTQVAILLGEKDLQLSRYTAWERVQLSFEQKRGVWMTMNGQILMKDNLFSLGKQFPRNGQTPLQIFEANRSLFLNLDLFFVKISEFMFVVPNFPHLRGLEIQVAYQELRIPQTADQLGLPFIQQKWKQDPETPGDQIFAPRPKYYMNGMFIRDDGVAMTRVTKDPPPEDRYPRREGITRVFESDADYEEVCKKQGLLHLIRGYQASPTSLSNPHLDGLSHPSELPNGITPPRSEKSRSVNGGSPLRSSISELQVSPQLTNGVITHDAGPANP